MPKFLRILLQAIGLVRKYEPVVEAAVKEATPLVKDILAKQKAK